MSKRFKITHVQLFLLPRLISYLRSLCPSIIIVIIIIKQVVEEGEVFTGETFA